MAKPRKAHPSIDAQYGRFPPHLRFAGDQVGIQLSDHTLTAADTGSRVTSVRKATGNKDKYWATFMDILCAGELNHPM